MSETTNEFQAGTPIANREGTETGTTTGFTRACQQEGCRGRRIGVRWSNGEVTHPCTHGLRSTADGGWQII